MNEDRRELQAAWAALPAAYHQGRRPPQAKACAQHPVLHPSTQATAYTPTPTIVTQAVPMAMATPAATPAANEGLVFIENKEGALRVCADYRVLNTLMHKDVAACWRLLDRLSGRQQAGSAQRLQRCTSARVRMTLH